jgi:hypothetical protein
MFTQALADVMATPLISGAVRLDVGLASLTDRAAAAMLSRRRPSGLVLGETRRGKADGETYGGEEGHEAGHRVEHGLDSVG